MRSIPASCNAKLLAIATDGAAAETWIEFIREDEQQRAFMAAGFRPGTDIALDDPAIPSVPIASAPHSPHWPTFPSNNEYRSCASPR